MLVCSWALEWLVIEEQRACDGWLGLVIWLWIYGDYYVLGLCMCAESKVRGFRMVVKMEFIAHA
jgi:hypothetical protein